MYTGWTAHLKEEEKEDFQRRIWRSKQVLDRVSDLIDREIKAVDDTERDPKAYDNPAWPYKQAYKNGMRAGLSFIKQFVDLDKQKKPTKEDDR
jgi:hypothetical protein